MSVHIQIEKFEGPLGLLLYLIRREEMDIFDININEITKQYLDYIRSMKKLDLERAGEFVAMAATLIQIKSRMLLPTYDEDGEEIVSEDPRKELVRRLLEYQKYQEAGQKLYERPLLGRDLWARGERIRIKNDQEDEIIVEEENALFALIKAYRFAIKNMRKKTHSVVASMQSISERIREIKHLLSLGRTHKMSELLSYEERRNVDKVLITFLSMLELAKIGLVSIFQNETFGELYIDAKKEIVADAISRVDEYEEGRSAEEVAESLLQEAESEAFLQEQLEDAEEDQQLSLGQMPVDQEEQEESIEAASDDDILAEELRIQEEDEKRQHLVENVQDVAADLNLQAHLSDEELANVSFVSDDGKSTEESRFHDVSAKGDEDMRSEGNEEVKALRVESGEELS
ncbi:MAG: segregation/condensation protein A [Bdellovibrionales bacterium]|nr:segregation/condensation protein A [Bdellovibrionales bacterium]